MAIDQEEFLHLARPVLPTGAGFSTITAPLSVSIQPQAVVSILDHAVRRETSSTQSARVIGALVGVRSEDGLEVEVRSCFAIPHTETDDQVEVDVEYQKNMLALTLKAAPRESLLGWYTTSHALDSFSALIQNFFAAPDTGTFPHPAVHLTISTEPGRDIESRCYVSSPVAASPDRAADSCFFVEVPHRLLYGDADRAALEAVAAAATPAHLDSRAAPVVSDVEALASSIEQTLDLLDRTADFVGGVIDEEREPNHAIGQYLMNAMSLAPKADNLGIERDFNNHIQDVLMCSLRALYEPTGLAGAYVAFYLILVRTLQRTRKSADDDDARSPA
ncbi:eukaryotic translation initiation factor 3 subunit [Grosmannia clavigera kw1407]|uniref:Eukaryotic translation initiation factor 3 subunit n=1 Tax=Grosmannia clavigera (strain kw1407 / UAMH 11150) TaxID=655863 RepID=F0XSL7_GROCL|nr:eukaryotic translation initiation factor 3 subunit [Grosmannia clavigera kw1407]EFW99295.1 eukaryotic translation initiation factor 3 subunit [Grosmannia clavigera kw1407]